MQHHTTQTGNPHTPPKPQKPNPSTHEYSHTKPKRTKTHYQTRTTHNRNKLYSTIPTNLNYTPKHNPPAQPTKGSTHSQTHSKPIKHNPNPRNQIDKIKPNPPHKALEHNHNTPKHQTKNPQIQSYHTIRKPLSCHPRNSQTQTYIPSTTVSLNRKKTETQPPAINTKTTQTSPNQP